MSSVKGVIAEDEPLLRQALRRDLLVVWPELEICAEAADGNEALAALDAHAPQVLFLDIQMPGLSGLEVAQRAGGRAHVAFITAYDQHAIAAFEQGALDYVLKPFSVERLAVTVTRMRARLGSAPADLRGLVERLRELVTTERPHLQWITVLQGKERRLVTVGEVCFFRSDAKYTEMVTARSEHLLGRPLKQLAEELDPRIFWRIHRSVIVNVHAIRSVTRDLRGHLQVHLRERPETLPVSQPYAHLFRHL
jgi:DNA-binding LytR/AlgR family response regulator